ncbi:formate C-acetyltransferase [Erysipelothrix sp. HDW6A]|uniref:formate C-acetyltransferase n=1 Tax=Erysipelothrix sp. HDW6A TaxID=2714928 RepID=UPI00140963D8|nr:formate C-acetyltransferase [Erysipelothrix sp. HDW6A]QIK56509.1 formate C-acetyltransferase [Erysipelothrix sp. HDW6A]
MTNAWNGFKTGKWQDEINVRDFIQQNVTPYEGDDKFLAPISDNTDRLWKKSLELLKEEVKVRVLDIEMNEMSGIDNFGPGYIIKEDEEIVGLQTDAPLKRIINPYGGIRLVDNILDIYGRKLDDKTSHFWHTYTKTHNAGVFDAYTPEIRKYRTTGLLTGLPDAYGRGRIIGDYRRIALYGTDYLVEEKKKDLNKITTINAETIQLREEVNEQIRALGAIKSMAAKYGCDISVPATNAKEAIQWTYLGYLAAIKENNGAAMSLGRTSTFLDIYIERDLEAGVITEKEAQMYIDQFIMKLRLARHLRTPEYDDLFAGDPTWVTESIGGMGKDGRTLVTKNSFRYLHTLTNLGPAPEPNMTVLWSDELPIGFKRYCAKMSIETGAIQYENDDIMRPQFGDDYGIACCVSAMEIGKQMQYFGARTNLAKALLYAINGGVDEVKGIKVIDNVPVMDDEVLDYEKVVKVYDEVIREVARVYVDTMNIIHYMHDKYAYEKSQMALHDTNVQRLMAFGIAGLSVAADSLSAIKYAKVKPIRNEQGIAIDFEIEGDYPKYGNDDDRVDSIAVELVERFSGYLKEHPIIRDAKHTLSILTITSNVVYGKKTGSTPDGRHAGEPFAPGANPMHGRDSSGALASLNSVAKIPYNEVCEDGVSNTFSIVPQVLGKSEDERINNLVGVMNGYFNQKAHHLNVNVLNRELLQDAMKNPEKYPQLTIRVSGYAVNFNRLSTEQQEEVISRTFHETI